MSSSPQKIFVWIQRNISRLCDGRERGEPLYVLFFSFYIFYFLLLNTVSHATPFTVSIGASTAAASVLILDVPTVYGFFSFPSSSSKIIYHLLLHLGSSGECRAGDVVCYIFVPDLTFVTCPLIHHVSCGPFILYAADAAAHIDALWQREVGNVCYIVIHSIL